jgi:hypothetical protein
MFKDLIYTIFFFIFHKELGTFILSFFYADLIYDTVFKAARNLGLVLCCLTPLSTIFFPFLDVLGGKYRIIQQIKGHANIYVTILEIHLSKQE